MHPCPVQVGFRPRPPLSPVQQSALLQGFLHPRTELLQGASLSRVGASLSLRGAEGSLSARRPVRHLLYLAWRLTPAQGFSCYGADLPSF